MEFIRIDCYHYFRKDEIIGFVSIGGDDGEQCSEICKGENDSYIRFYFKNGTNILVSFGNDDDCCQHRNAYMTYLDEIFVGNDSKQVDRINEILREQNPDEYKYLG